jgi:hypothetical protein
MEISVEFPQETKNRATIDLAMTLGHISEGM